MAADFKKILVALASGNPLLWDGAMGTMLMRAGLDQGIAPETWNRERPEAVAAVSRAYGEAGSDVVTTNTFGANRLKLAHYGEATNVASLNRLGAQAAREGVGAEGLVAGSIGPCGAFLEPLGELKPEDLTEIFAEQATALAEGGCDLLLIETMTCSSEARCALEGARRACDLPVGALMTFDPTPNGFFTVMGVSPKQAAEELDGADFLGTNCGNGMEGIIAIVAELRKHTEKPLLANANAGIPRLEGGRTVFPETPAEMAAKLPALLEAGANFAGGCCGTDPETIRAFREAIGG